MKDINFISTLSPQKQKKIYTWYTKTLGILYVMVLIICVFEIPRIRHIIGLQHQVDDAQNKERELKKIMETKGSLSTQMKKYKNLVKRFKKMTNTQHLWAKHLSTIYQVCGDSLNSLSISGKKISLSTHCEHPRQGVTLLNKLSQCPNFKNLTLNLSQSGQNELLIIIDGDLVPEKTT